MLAGQPGNPGAGHLFAAPRRHGVFRPQPGGLNQAGGHAARRGGHDRRRARTGLRPVRVSPGRLGQAANLAVAQAVVDEGDEFTGGRHPPDVAAAAVGHAVVVEADGGRTALA